MGKVLASVAKLPPFTISRKRPAAERALMRNHVRQVGEIVYAWNSLQGGLYVLYHEIMHHNNFGLTHSLWHVIQSDKTQREMLEAAIIHGLKHRRSIQSAALWLVSNVTDLLKYRNDAAHVQMIYDADKLKPNMFTSRTAAAQRLSVSPIESYWRKLRGDLYALETFALDLAATLSFGERRPLSKRPRLLLSQAKSARSRQALRLRKTTMRQPQPSSSRE